MPETKSASRSKIIITSVVMLLSNVAVMVLGPEWEWPAETQATLVTAIDTVAAVLIIVFRRWFTTKLLK